MINKGSWFYYTLDNFVAIEIGGTTVKMLVAITVEAIYNSN